MISEKVIRKFFLTSILLSADYEIIFPGYHAHPAMAYNVIAVHWQPLSTWDNYFTAAKNSVKVGQHAGQVLGLDLLIDGLGQRPEQIHAIGHSLGAHLVGHFARTIQFKAGSIARVTGKFNSSDLISCKKFDLNLFFTQDLILPNLGLICQMNPIESVKKMLPWLISFIPTVDFC